MARRKTTNGTNSVGNGLDGTLKDEKAQGPKLRLAGAGSVSKSEISENASMDEKMGKMLSPVTRPAIQTWEGGKTGKGDVPALAVLIACGERRRAERLAGMLIAHRLNISYVRTAGELETYVAARAWDVVITEDALAEGSGVEVLAHLAAGVKPGVCVVVAAKDDAAGAVRALRAGATDVVSLEAGAECAERLNGALCQAEELRRREKQDDKRVLKLKGLCRTLSRSRHELRREVAELGEELASIKAEIESKLKKGSLASEFGTIVRQELEIEGLLRTVLEFLLPRLGATNAAIFLPGSSGDYSLGAYVNYDVPKDSCEILLDHLAATLAPKFEAEEGVITLASREQMVRKLGNDAEWLDDSGVAAISCRDGNECLAVLVLFRDRRIPYTAAHLGLLETIRDLFASQLSRVIRTHNRHQPKHQWGATDEGNEDRDERDDDIDLAA